MKEKMQINTIYKKREKPTRETKQKFNEYYEPLYTNQVENLHKMHRSLRKLQMSKRGKEEIEILSINQ